MKKSILLISTISILVLSACSESKDKEDDKKSSEISVCECVKMSEEMMKEMEGVIDDEVKMKEIEEKYKETAEACKKLGEGKSDEEMKKLQEEASKCK